MAVKQPTQRYYNIDEVNLHNTANDCWVILFGEVYDLTSIIQKNIDSNYLENYRKINKAINLSSRIRYNLLV